MNIKNEIYVTKLFENTDNFFLVFISYKNDILNFALMNESGIFLTSEPSGNITINRDKIGRWEIFKSAIKKNFDKNLFSINEIYDYKNRNLISILNSGDSLFFKRSDLASLNSQVREVINSQAQIELNFVVKKDPFLVIVFDKVNNKFIANQSITSGQNHDYVTRRAKAVVKHLTYKITSRLQFSFQEDFEIKIYPFDHFNFKDDQVFYMNGPPGPRLIPTIYDRTFSESLDITDISFPEHKSKWEKRLSLMHWRGSTTGSHDGIPIENNFRVQQCIKFKNNIHFDMKISDVVQYKNPSIQENFLRSLGVMGARILLKDFENYNFFPDLPGNALAWGTIARHVQGALVFRAEKLTGKYESQSLLWHQGFLPWIHFVPIKSDFSDLEDKFFWAQENPDKALIISYRGMVMSRDYLRLLDEITFSKLFTSIHFRGSSNI